MKENEREGGQAREKERERARETKKELQRDMEREGRRSLVVSSLSTYIKNHSHNAFLLANKESQSQYQLLSTTHPIAEHAIQLVLNVHAPSLFSILHNTQSL